MVDPSLGLRERRSQLVVAWGFGQCDCERCVEEEREVKSGGEQGEGETKDQSDMDSSWASRHVLFSPRVIS